jgi:hypothetical protein
MLGIDPEKFPKETAASVEAINNLARRESLGFAISLLNKFDLERKGHKVDKVRLEIVLHRIVRGIFYHHHKLPLPKSVAFKFGSIGNTSGQAAILRETADKLATTLRTIGNGVFRYAFMRLPFPHRFDSVWLLTFYDHRAFLCVTSASRG